MKIVQGDKCLGQTQILDVPGAKVDSFIDVLKSAGNQQGIRTRVTLVDIASSPIGPVARCTCSASADVWPRAPYDAAVTLSANK